MKMNLFRKKSITDSMDSSSRLKPCLTAADLIFLGIGAIIGAGIFVLTGIVAATQAGPAIIFSYIVAGFACAFSALAYAELSSTIGGCGSAYGYAYAGFGELIAWIVGWDLLLEYMISVPAVSAGWSSYGNDLLKVIGIHLPEALTHTPAMGGVFDVLAFSIIMLISFLLAIGVKSSARINTLMVITKLVVIGLFIIVASSNVTPENWNPLMPFGWSGVVHGAALIFFAYIGFDAVSTAAEEAINPQRDIPIGILSSLLVCTLLYIIVSGLLTGIVHYSTLNVASPISHALIMIGYPTVAGFVGVGALAGLTTVMLVLYYGLTRIIFAMSRDGLLPKFFAHTDANTHTPVRIIMISGLVMATIAGLVPIHDLAELVNIGTLFAFATVCVGVIVLRYREPHLKRPFKTPLMPLTPILGIIACISLICNLPSTSFYRFIIWMAAGLVIYFCYSRYQSRLHTPTNKGT